MTNYKQLAEELYDTLKRVRCFSASNAEIVDAISKYEEATTRGTGRTTALYMKAITEALENPGKSVEFIDHYPYKWDSALHHADNLRDIIKKLGYDIEVGITKNKVFLINRFER